MRKKLFKEIYMLLQEFCGEILGDYQGDIRLKHNDEKDERYDSFARRLDENHIMIGILGDPAFTILFDDNLKIARITEFQLCDYKRRR